MFPKNFLLQNNIPHFIDLEGAGILNEDHTKWNYVPSVAGTPFPGFGYPPEKDMNQYTDRWHGLTLIFLLLTGFSPFYFLSRSDLESLKKLQVIGQKNIENARSGGKTLVWPPYGIDEHPYVVKSCITRLNESRECLNSSQVGKTLIKLCYNTFIKGFNNLKLRESFYRIFTLLGL